MVAFLTQSVVDVFGVSGIKLCLIDNACSNRSCKARIATGKHCQHTAKVSHSNSPPLIPKTLTLVLLKALIRTNDNRGFLFKLPFNGAGFAFGDELPLLLKTPIHNSVGLFFELPFTLQAKRVVCRSPSVRHAATVSQQNIAQ